MDQSSSKDSKQLPYKKVDYSPLWHAMLGGQVDKVERLIGLGGDPDEKCERFNGRPFLQYAAKLESSEYSSSIHRVVEVLVRHGAKVNTSVSPKFGSPIFTAIACGNAKLTELLLENGAQLEEATWRGVSPWEITFMIEDDPSCKAMMQLLVKHGLDTGYRDEEGKNLLHMFLDSDMRQDDGVEIVEMILDYGVSVDELDEDGYSALHRVIAPLREDPTIKNSDIEMAKLLIKRGANVNLKNRSLGKPPLSLAVLQGSDKLVDLLLSSGAEINAKDSEHGYTALHTAFLFYNKMIIELLIRRGADVNAKDKHGRTPFSLRK